MSKEHFYSLTYHWRRITLSVFSIIKCTFTIIWLIKWRRNILTVFSFQKSTFTHFGLQMKRNYFDWFSFQNSWNITYLSLWLELSLIFLFVINLENWHHYNPELDCRLEHLTMPVLVDRLVLRKLFGLAIIICQYLKVPDAEGQCRIMAHWACYKVSVHLGTATFAVFSKFIFLHH